MNLITHGPENDTNQVGPGEKLGMSLDTSDTLVALVSLNFVFPTLCYAEHEYDLLGTICTNPWLTFMKRSTSKTISCRTSMICFE